MAVYVPSRDRDITPTLYPVGCVGGPTNDHAWLMAAMDAAAARDGIVRLSPRSYTFLDDVDVPPGVALIGVPGFTRFDFSGKADFANSPTSGLLKATGSLGTAVALAHSTRRTVPIVFRLLSATRSGTTVTAQTDLPHGLAVGDPIWVTGNPSTVGQGVFYSVVQAIGATARTTPFVVATVPDSTHLTYAVANTGDTSLSGIAFCNFASDIIVVGSTTGFVAGQDVMIRSAAYRTSASEAEQNHIGELARIARIVSSTMILLHADVQDDYAVADTAEIVPVAFHKGFAIEGVEIVGKGPNTGAGYGDRGIVAYLAEEPRVERCRINAVDQMGVYIWSCLGGSVRSNLISFDASDEGGFSSGAQDIQYGIAFGGCTTGLDISSNYVYGGRHAIVQSMTSTVGYNGVARNISITGNTLRGQWLASIATHQGADTLVITGNIIEGAQGGINPRYSRDTVIADNVITAYGYGVYCYNYIGNFTVLGNVVRAGQWCIRVGREVDSASVYGPLKIVGNNCEGGEYGIYVFDATAGIVAIDIDVSGNTVRGTKYEGIRVSLGDDAASGDGWYGKVNGNTVLDAGQAGSRSGMWFTNFRGGTANDNTFRGDYTLDYAFTVDGAGTADRLLLMDNQVAPGLLGTAPVNALAGAWHRTNMPPLAVATGKTVIASGVAAPRLATALVVVDTEGLASTDDLDTLVAGFIGQQVTLRSVTNSRVITVKDNTGNIQLAGSADRVLDNTRDTVTLMFDGSSWNEMAFASN